MTHDHGESGAGFFAGMSAMMFMLIALVLVVLLVAAFAWRPRGSDGDAPLAPVEEWKTRSPGASPAPAMVAAEPVVERLRAPTDSETRSRRL